jgi:superfamily II DNA or RNA helicase
MNINDKCGALFPENVAAATVEYRADIDSVLRECEKLGRKASELSGRKNELEDWQAGRTSVLVANTASGGIGIDLTRASYAFFYSLGHSLSEYLQAVARLHRPGQKKHTNFFNLVATINGNITVDGQVYKALEGRQEVIDAIITGYRRTNTVRSA